MEDHRQRRTEDRKTGRRVGTRLIDDPVVAATWRRTSRLRSYGLTHESFDALRKTQGNACGMCRRPFKDGETIRIDHDHDCCDREKGCCGRCVRGLLCIGCNRTPGHVERYRAVADAYLAAPPAQPRRPLAISA
ncbi:MAG TPA: endonuclease domain-containing protein [Trebonia sp.]